jgi:acyl carrier protein
MSQVFERVRSLMVDEFQIESGKITPKTPLAELGVDSLAALEFMFVLEDAFSITLDAETDLRGGLVQNVVDVVESAMSRRRAAA